MAPLLLLAQGRIMLSLMAETRRGGPELEAGREYTCSHDACLALSWSGRTDKTRSQRSCGASAYTTDTTSSLGAPTSASKEPVLTLLQGLRQDTLIDVRAAGCSSCTDQKHDAVFLVLHTVAGLPSTACEAVPSEALAE